MLEKYRAYLATGELYIEAQNQTVDAEQRDHIILWVRNYGGTFRRDEAQPDRSFLMEFGSSSDEGGVIYFSENSSVRARLSKSLDYTMARKLHGNGFLATPASRYPNGSWAKPEPLRVTTSFFKATNKTGAELELAPNDQDGGGTVTLTNAQREDLAAFLDAGKLNKPEITPTPTELVFPDGHVESVDTDQLGKNPTQFL